MMRRAHGWAVVSVVAIFGVAGCGGNGNKGGTAAIKSADVVARAAAFQRPLDAAPSPDGSVIYFSSTGERGPAVLRVGASGGTVSTLVEGTPLADPTGVAVATDGSRVYLADHQAQAAGAILTASSTGAGNAATVLSGTEGRAPGGSTSSSRPVPT